MQYSHKSVKKQLFLFITLMINIFSLFANELPLQKESIFRIEYPAEIQYISALIQNKDTSTLVYESWKGYEMNKGDYGDRFTRSLVEPFNYIFSLGIELNI